MASQFLHSNAENSEEHFKCSGSNRSNTMVTKSLWDLEHTSLSAYIKIMHFFWGVRRDSGNLSGNTLTNKWGSEYVT